MEVTCTNCEQKYSNTNNLVYVRTIGSQDIYCCPNCGKEGIKVDNKPKI